MTSPKPNQPKPQQPISQPITGAFPNNPQFNQVPVQQKVMPDRPVTAVPTQPYYYQPPVQPYPQIVINNNVKPGPNFLVRALWYVFIGWWLAGIWATIGYGLCLTVLGIPVGLLMLNRLPGVLTLRPRTIQTQVSYNAYGQVVITNSTRPQHNMLLRTVYFIFIGSWLSGIWIGFAYAISIFIVTIPVTIMMFDRIPAILTLRRN